MFADDAANLLDAIGITEPAHIIGHSMGGRVCQWLAIDHPQKVRSMIQAASGSGSMGNPDYPRWLTLHSLENLIEKGYREYMWSHFQSRFFQNNIGSGRYLMVFLTGGLTGFVLRPALCRRRRRNAGGLSGDLRRRGLRHAGETAQVFLAFSRTAGTSSDPLFSLQRPS
jgi:pimeloyl-ACP methyl ester carboxylesterase